MAIQSSMEMVRWTDPAAGEWDVTLPPFEQFMHALIARYADPICDAAGEYRYGFPVEQAVASGLWLVMAKVAKKFALEMETTTQTVGTIAPRTDALLNTGLAFAYAGPEMAADAFFYAVIQPVERERANARMQKAEPLENAFDLKTAEFFLGLIKRVLDRKQEVESALAAFHRAADEPVHRMDGIFASEDKIDLMAPQGPAREIGDWMRAVGCVATDGALAVRDQSDSLHAYRIAAALCHGVRRVQEATRLAQACRHLPVAYKHMPEDIPVGLTNVETSWINTQLLLASADAPDQEHINGEQYLAAMDRLTRDSGDVVGRFLRRMVRRDPQYQRWHRFLERMLGERVKALMHFEKNVISPSTMLEVYLRPEGVAVQVTGMEAEELATGQLEESAARIPLDEAARSIRWETLDREGYERIVEQEVLQPEMVADGILRMDRRLRAEAVAHALHSVEWKAYLDAFLDRGLYELDARLVEGREGELRTDLLLRWLSGWAEKGGDLGKRSDEMSQLIIRSLARLEKKPLRALLENEGTRVAFAECFYTYFAPLEGKERQNEYLPLREKIPQGLWRKEVFSAALLMREESYAWAARGRKKSSIGISPEWGTKEAVDEVVIQFSHLLGKTRDEVVALMKRETEEDIFRWLHASEKGLARRLAEFRRHRTAYVALMSPKKKTRK